MSQATVAIGSLNSQDMIRILKQSRHDFSGKHLYDGYCMDIMYVYVCRSKFNRGSYRFVKLLEEFVTEVCLNVKVLEC